MESQPDDRHGQRGEEAGERVERAAIEPAVGALGPEVQLEGARNDARALIEHPVRLDAVAVGAQQRLRLGDGRRVVLRDHVRTPGAERRRLYPVADAFLREPAPVELLARIDLAPWRDVGVGEDALRPDAAALSDVAAERRDGLHLLQRKVGIAAVVAGVVDLDADRGRVDVALAGPVRGARVPGALRLRHHLRDDAGLVDDVVGRDLALGPRQPVDRLFGRYHAGVVQHHEVRC